MSKGLLSRQTISWVHLKEPNHELKSLLGQTRHVSLLQGLRLGDLGKLEPNEAWVLVEALHLFFGQRSKHLLNQVELVHL